MPDFNVRSDSVNVEQIMEQIRARIREKRGVDYTEQQIRELAAVKLEKFLDPRGVRSDLLNEFRRGEPDPNYAFEDDTLFRSTRRRVELIRRLLPPAAQAVLQSEPAHPRAAHAVADQRPEREPASAVLRADSQSGRRNDAARHRGQEPQMRVESLDARVDFSERRARALEGAVIYRPGRTTKTAPASAPDARPGTRTRIARRLRRPSRLSRVQLAATGAGPNLGTGSTRKAPVSAANGAGAGAAGGAARPPRRSWGSPRRPGPQRVRSGRDPADRVTTGRRSMPTSRTGGTTLAAAREFLGGSGHGGADDEQ